MTEEEVEGLMEQMNNTFENAQDIETDEGEEQFFKKTPWEQQQS